MKNAPTTHFSQSFPPDSPKGLRSWFSFNPLVDETS